LVTGVPVPQTDQSAKTVLYYTPYIGDSISLWNGASWQTVIFTEKSIDFTVLANNISANVNYDIFGFLSAGTLALDPPFAWATSGAGTSTRVANLTRQDGRLVKNGDATRLYLGTIRGTGANQTSDTAAGRYVWNSYNRTTRPMLEQSATNSWTYTTATWRQANADTANQVAHVVGFVDDDLYLSLGVIASCAVADAAVSVGVDSTTTPNANMIISYQSGTITAAITAYLTYQPTIGYHFYAWLEISPTGSGTVTWFGFIGTNPVTATTSGQSGISGTWSC
jgi:hypothetical protein